MSRLIDDDSFPETWKRTKEEQAEYDHSCAFNECVCEQVYPPSE